MATRDDLFHQFGPKLFEAMFMTLLDEVNTLRPGQGQPTISMQDLMENASNHVTDIPDYDWMEEFPEG